MTEIAILPPTEANKLLRIATIPFRTHLDTDLALIVLNLHDAEDLKKLCDMGVLKRYPGKGRNFCYKKSELEAVREALDRRDIIL